MSEETIQKYLKMRKEHDDLEEKIKNLRLECLKMKKLYAKTDDQLKAV